VAATYQLRLFLNHNIDGKLAAPDQYQQRVGFLLPPGTLHFGPSLPPALGPILLSSQIIKAWRGEFGQVEIESNYAITVTVHLIASGYGEVGLTWLSTAVELRFKCTLSP